MIEKFKPEYKSKNYEYYYCNGEGLPLYSDFEAMCEKLPVIKVGIHDSGMISTHNMPCCICMTNHAVFIQGEGYFQPCWPCKEKGYRITKISDKKKKGIIENFLRWIKM